LVVYASKKNQQWVSALIKQLDEYRPQVLLDCTLVEVTKDDDFQYSFNLIGKTYGGTSIQGGSPVGDSATYGNFSRTGTMIDAASMGGNVTAFLNTSFVQALLTAVQTNNYGRIMAQPKLLVNDNQEGEIKTSTQTSIAKVSSDYTTSDSGSSNKTYDVSFNQYEEGVTLTIKPHISKGDMLRLEITMNRTDFELKDDITLPDGDYPRPPDLLSTDVTTTVTVPDGTTIILGGLESIDQHKNRTKVPLLGDLPLIGALFRSVSNPDEQSKLYIFVKANIIRPGNQAGSLEDIRRVSNKYRRRFEISEKQFHDLSNVPGIKDKPMNPIRILEPDDFDYDLEPPRR
jgi:general secretion pathway protein D